MFTIILWACTLGASVRRQKRVTCPLLTCTSPAQRTSPVHRTPFLHLPHRTPLLHPFRTYPTGHPTCCTPHSSPQANLQPTQPVTPPSDSPLACTRPQYHQLNPNLALPAPKQLSFPSLLTPNLSQPHFSPISSQPTGNRDLPPTMHSAREKICESYP